MDVVIGTLVAIIEAVTAPIPFLADSGLLLLLFATMWLALGVAIVVAPARVDAAWRRLRALPLLVQALAWVLLLPIVAGIAVWQLGWPRLARMTVVLGIAIWNLLVFLPAA
jgi:hypothetical protein